MAASVPAPYVLLASAGQWHGNDGNWSTFRIDVGTPGQAFNVVPSIIGAETWVPVAQGCPSGDYVCAASRGVVAASNGSLSTGFEYDSSSTWDQIGIYNLPYERDVYAAANATGFYGMDTVALGNGTGLKNQTVAGISTEEFWLGSFGLGPQPALFPRVQAEDIPSLLVSMKAADETASLSFGYNAGAWYSECCHLDDKSPEFKN